MRIRCNCGQSVVVLDRNQRYCSYCGLNYNDSDICVESLVDREKEGREFFLRIWKRYFGLFSKICFISLMAMLVRLFLVLFDILPMPSLIEKMMVISFFIFAISSFVWLVFYEDIIRRKTADEFSDLFNPPKHQPTLF